ncbi:hypothetical protein [Zobellella sp. An-6]|uniref:hypothetical protein n=1 Tax=Zobellella sp. An-6 TaxID=3400218 RepID=UPI004042A48C
MATTLLLQMSPIGMVVALILAFRRPPVQAALIGVVLVLLLWGLGVAAPLSRAVALAIATDTGVLFLSTAGVIVPGLAFVILVEKQGAPQAIGAWVKELGWPPAAQVIFIVLGLAPLLEAMTGFGVSLIATVPLFMGLFSRQLGLRIALSGMVIMPWGTLGLATLIGALLAAQPSEVLASHSALISAPVFLVLAAIALWLAGIRTLGPWLALFVVTALFVAVLYMTSRWTGPEIAGVMAGLAVSCVGLVFSFLSTRRLVAWPGAAWPYLALLAIIVALRGLFLATGWDSYWEINGDSVAWKPLASPGVALALVALMMSIRQREQAELHVKFPWSQLFARAKRPVATILFFLLMSQIMVKAGFLLQAQQGLQSLTGIALGPMVAAIAGIAGYVTGSNVGGNTLIMPSIAGLETTQGPWLAAMVNSAAGHGALGSLSILSLITGLAAASREEEHSLIRFAFGLVVLSIVIVAAAGSILLYMS